MRPQPARRSRIYLKTNSNMSALTKTDFHFPGQTGVYHGKVRDVYNIGGQQLVMVATDRISAFDVVLPEGIPYKGQVNFSMRRPTSAPTGSRPRPTPW